MKLDYSTEGMKRSIHNTLDTLGLGYLDLLFLHEPHLVPLNEIERILDTLHEFKALGLTRRLGVQSHDEKIALLPALQDEWSEGEVKDLRTRGAFEINMKWMNNKVTNLEIISKQVGL